MSFTSVFPATSPGPQNLDGATSSSREGVIRVLVGALADNSRQVGEAAASALQEPKLACLNARAILDACIISLRSGKRKDSHHPLVLQVMAAAVEHMEETQLDPAILHKLAKQAVLEMSYPKDIDSDGMAVASRLLVAIGLRMPDVMIEEAFVPPPGTSVPITAIVRALAQFAEKNAFAMVPRLKKVLARVLPVLGGVYDGQRFIFAEAMSSWCEAMVQYQANTGASPLDTDMQAAIHSAFDLFSGRWLGTRDTKVRMAVIEALGCMAGLIRPVHLKAGLPKLLPSILSLYRKENQEHYRISRGLRGILEACLTKEKSPPLVDFQTVSSVLSSLLPEAGNFPDKAPPPDPNAALKNCNEALGCFVVVGAVYPDDTCSFLVHRLSHRDELVRLGAYSALRHLIYRLSGPWERKKRVVVDAVKGALHEENLSLRKALAQVIVAMASNSYLEEENAEPFVRFLIWQCRYPDKRATKNMNRKDSFVLIHEKAIRAGDKDELKVGEVTPEELFTVCEKSLLLLATTLPNFQPWLWPVLLRVLMPRCFTGAVATVCKCIVELAKHNQQELHSFLPPVGVQEASFPQPQALFARLVVLLQNEKAPHGHAYWILQLLKTLPFLFHQGGRGWEDQILKMEVYLREGPKELQPVDTGQQAVWESLVMDLVSLSLDIVDTAAWSRNLGDAFAAQYDLYVGDHLHISLLHRCFGLALQRVNDKAYVKDKINLMYRRADIFDEADRYGLGMGIGLVAARHLDTVLEKLHKILETEGRSLLRWIILYFVKSKQPSTDDVCSALALMFGYTAAYAPSNVIEIRIDALVGTNVLTHLIDVRTPSAKQAVITAVYLLAKGVQKAAKDGLPFPLKKRDDMIGYMLMYMADTGYYLGPPDPDLLKTQAMALQAITILVCINPKLGIVVRDRIIQAAIPFFALPTEPSERVMSVITNVTSLLCALLLTSLENEKVDPDLLLQLLRQLEPYASSAVSIRRTRACQSVLALLCQFRLMCTQGNTVNTHQALNNLQLLVEKQTASSEIVQREPAGLLSLPPRPEMRMGEHLVIYIPRCADAVAPIRAIAVQVLDVFFSIILMLPHPSEPDFGDNREAALAALSALEGLVAPASQHEASEDLADNFRKIVSAIGVLLTPDELVGFLLNVNVAFTDRTHSAAQGAISASLQLILLRGHELNVPSLPKITELFLSAVSNLYDQGLRLSMISSICALAEHAQAGVVFNELLAALERDAGLGVRSFGSRHREPWPTQAVLQMVADSPVLGRPLLDHLVDVVDKAPLFLEPSPEEVEKPWPPSKNQVLNPLPQAATLALATVFQSNSESVKRDVEASYASLFCSLLLRVGSVRSSSDLDLQALRDLITTLQAFCDCTADLSMKEVVNKYAISLAGGEGWIDLAGGMAECQSTASPWEVENISNLISPALKSLQESHRAIAAAALSKYLQNSDDKVLQGRLVEVLRTLTNDASPLVRRLCIDGLVKMSDEAISRHITDVLAVTASLIEDKEDRVILLALQGLSKVFEQTPTNLVTPLLLGVCARLFTLQKSDSDKMRAAAFIAFGTLSRFIDGDLHTILLEQMHRVLPRLLFHVDDDSAEVRSACKSSLRRIVACLSCDVLEELLDHRAFLSDRRLKYKEFIRDFIRHLAANFQDQSEVYLTSALESMEGATRTIQANSCYFVGCFLGHVEDSFILHQHLAQASAMLVRLASTSNSPLVRTNSTQALSLLLRHIPLTF